MQVVISPQSLLEMGIRVEKVDDLRLFKFTDDLQDKLEELIAKNQSATLTHTEQEELNSISELDSPSGEAAPTHLQLSQFAISCPKMSVSEFTKKYVRNRADYLCEYCHSPEKISASRFTIDHLQPRSLGGSDTEENLALACNR
jgi:5-methylcytosine-specific restriction endonuclease McrA